jgi:hypothetical protein
LNLENMNNLNRSIWDWNSHKDPPNKETPIPGWI